MALDAATAQAQIYNEVGGNIDFGNRPEHEIPLVVATYWNKNSELSSQPNLQYARTKLDCIEFLLGQLRALTNAGIADINPQVGVRFQNLLQLEKLAEQDVDYWSKWYANNRTSVIEINPAVAPIERDCWPFGPNPNSRRLRGDALRRQLFNE